MDEVADRIGGSGWLGRASAVVAELGFELVTGAQPDRPASADLVVALRAKPTLAHFDPEQVDYWTIVQGRGRPATLGRGERALPIERPFAWGRISISDRLNLSNQFLTFGGTLRAAAADASTLIAQFSSPAPIVRWAGHSQGTDRLAEPIGAFFARMMIPIDFKPEAEPLIASSEPLVLYCAFLRDLGARLERSEALRAAHPDLATWIPRECRRVSAVRAGAWQAAEELLGRLELE